MVALALLGVLYVSRPADAQTRFEIASQDPRVDENIRGMLQHGDELMRHPELQSMSAMGSAITPETDPAAAAATPQRHPIWKFYADATPETVIQMIVVGTMDRASLEATGAVVGTVAGEVTTISAPIAIVPAILDVPGVRMLNAATPMSPALNVSTVDIDAQSVWESSGAAPPVYSGYTGKGVVVGIVDEGINLAHLDFKKPNNGGTRILRAWHQNYPGTPPTGFTYGAEFTAAQIDAGTATIPDEYAGHGSHVSGIAAGNGQATGNSYPAYRYVGVAPEADLIIVKSPLTDVYVIDGVNYIFQKAAALGKKAVVNLSVTSQLGPHDGGASLDYSLSQLTGPGKLISAAAGNEGLMKRHARVNLTSTGQSATIQFNIPDGGANGWAQGDFVAVEGWYNPTAKFSIKLRSPTGIETPAILMNAWSGSLTTNDGVIQVANAQTTSMKGTYRVFCETRRASSTGPWPATGNWSIIVTRLSGATTGTIDFWIPMWSIPSTSPPAMIAPYGDNAMEIASPATGDSILATGSYVTKKSWVNSLGSNSSYGNLTLGAIADFSSIGPRRDGVQRPDVCAPGYGVASADGAGRNASAVFKVEDGVHRMMYGTSQSAAHTTGSIALALQQTPNLSPSAARLWLRSRVRTDSFTGGTLPNATWGYGKLDLTQSTTGVDEANLERFSFAAPYPNPSRDFASFQFALSAADLADPTRPAEVRILNVAGRQVRTINAARVPGIQRLTWNGADDNGVSAPPGVYFAQLVVGDQHATRKFVRIAE